MEEQIELLRPLSILEIVSVGIDISRNIELRKINQREPLSNIIEQICKDFNIPNFEKYSLQFDNHPTQLFSFITEENRNEICNGSICKLVYSPAVLVQTILEKMVSPGAEENLWSLQKVLTFLNDKAFVENFVKGEGVTILVTLLQGNALSYDATGYAFKCAAELLKLGFVPKESIKDRILDKVIFYILHELEGSARTQESCLLIAHILVEKYAATFPEIYKTVSIEKVIPHLRNTNFWVQDTALGLINSIFTAANTLQRKLLLKAFAKQIREVIYHHIIKPQKNIPEETCIQLALFQSRFLSRLRRKAESPVDMEDNLVKKRIKILARLSVEGDATSESQMDKKRNTFVETTLNLLSDYVIPPPIDTDSELPPSILVLDCMTHFTKEYHKNYTKAVLEHSIKTTTSEYPFVQLCSQLIKLLTDALGITNNNNNDIKDLKYHPVLFSCDKAFEELFCACIMVFRKTSKEMRARSEDFRKVLNVMKKKVEVALNKKPKLLKEFEATFYTLSYNEVSQIWQEELQQKERADLQDKKSLLLLKEEVKPQFTELIKRHRLFALNQGAHFPKFSSRGSKINRFWFVKYIPSQTLFEFHDEKEKFNDFRLELSKIKNIVVGQNCPHVKLRGQKMVPENAFSLILTEVEPNNILNLAATSEKQLHHVLDGFNTLLGHRMNSPAFAEDMQTLTDMYVRLELLDAYGVELPNEDPPPIPSDPPNFDFLPDL